MGKPQLMLEHAAFCLVLVRFAIPLERFIKNDFWVSGIEILNNSTLNEALPLTEALHGPIGKISGSEQFIFCANRLYICDEVCSDSSILMLRMYNQEWDKALFKKAIIHHDKTNNFSILARNKAFSSCYITAQFLSSAGISQNNSIDMADLCEVL
ncbi:hypothetical protein BCE02nite_45690 [Brevibacillus centrosporus]|nr:hypothetical protein BCE02nite_45690 [Brevibacillus centrosporus]